METIGAIANIIALVDLSANIAKVCFQYSKEVSSARADIERLRRQAEHLEITLKAAQRLVEEGKSSSLPTSQGLFVTFNDCKIELESTLKKLQPSPMRRYGFRSLKWPFKSKEIDQLLDGLKGYEGSILAGLQVDQTTLLLDIQERVKQLNLQATADASASKKPSMMMPFTPDPDFISRPSVEAWMKEQFSQPTQRMALVGMGGFGKSKLAIQFAHQVHVNPGKSVFWVHGGDKAAFEESYRALADVLAIPRRHEPGVNILALVRDWLQRDDVYPWFMIVDNADDGKVFFSEDDSVATYLPKSTKGKVLVTSRSFDTAQRLVGNIKAIYRIPIMAEDQALELMQSLLEAQANEDEAHDLVRALDCIPLAVKQAAAYINRRSPRVTTKSYLEDFYKSEKRKDNLLRSDKGDLDRQAGVSNSVVVTWQVTFKQIRDEHPSAANLLSLMSQFQSQNIPEFMLHWYDDECFVDDGEGIDDGRETNTRGGVNGDDTAIKEGSSGKNKSDMETDNDSERIAFENDLDILRSYSLVDITTEGHLSMHPLVQFCTRGWISELGDSARWSRLFIKLSAEHFPSGAFKDWSICQTLLPHVEPILGIKPIQRSAIKDWAALLLQVFYYMKAIGQYSRAQILAERSVESREALLGQGHLETLASKTALASIRRLQGKFKEAAELGAELVKARKSAHGVDDKRTLDDMSNLALVFYDQGHLDEAERLEVEILKRSQVTLGPDHRDTLTSMDNLAMTLVYQGRLQDAEKLMVELLERRQVKLGFEHLDTLHSMGNLASIFLQQGQPEKAERLELEVLERRKVMLGLDHPDTLVTMNNLASTFGRQGRFKEAETLELETLERRKATLGLEHPDTLSSINNLALTMIRQRRFKEAADLQLQLVETGEKVLGLDHPITVRGMYNLAWTRHEQGRIKDALFLMQDCACLQEQRSGRKNPDTRRSLETLQGWQAEVPLPEESEDEWETKDV